MKKIVSVGINNKRHDRTAGSEADGGRGGPAGPAQQQSEAGERRQSQGKFPHH